VATKLTCYLFQVLAQPRAVNILSKDTHQSATLSDQFGRRIDYLRLSVTDRCNLRCGYCMSEQMSFLPREQILTLEEIYELAKIFVELGVRKIRLTGGEPLIRKDIIKLVKALASLPNLQELTMTTNAVLLPEMARELKSSGVSRLNISIDTLQPERFAQLTRVGQLQQVIDGINAAISAEFDRIKLNMVVLNGVNQDEIIDLANYAISNGLDISYIEEMPLGEISSHRRENTQIASQHIKDRLAEQFDLLPCTDKTSGPSRYLRVAKSTTKIGFISPISDNFCDSCNRVRLTAEGRLLLCLGNEHSVDMRSIIRSKSSDAELIKQTIINAMQNKPERHHFDPNRTEIVRFMNMTGG
jgi:cyclic pyranopterin phosphate synthase